MRPGAKSIQPTSPSCNRRQRNRLRRLRGFAIQFRKEPVVHQAGIDPFERTEVITDPCGRQLSVYLPAANCPTKMNIVEIALIEHNHRAPISAHRSITLATGGSVGIPQIRITGTARSRCSAVASASINLCPPRPGDREGAIRRRAGASPHVAHENTRPRTGVRATHASRRQPSIVDSVNGTDREDGLANDDNVLFHGSMRRPGDPGI